jgi:hypothetical protein
MKDICSYFYSRLDGAEAQEEPTDLTNAVKEAMDHILTNVGLLGLTLINLEILKGSLEVYTKQLWVFLNEMENSLVPTAEEVITKCDMPWLKERMREYPVFTSLLRRKRQRVLKSMLSIINSDTPEFQIRFDLDPAFKREMTDIIRNTRARLERSKLYLRGSPLIRPAECFQSRTASVSLVTKLFSLLPIPRFTSKFVTFTLGCWRHVFTVAGIPLALSNQSREGYGTMVDSLNVFMRSLKFDKVRLEDR